MLFVFGVLGLLQSTVLPGAILLKLLGVRLSRLQQLVYTFALSLLLNYCAVLLLVLIRLYLQPVVLGLGLLEILVLAWLYRRELQIPALQTLTQAWNDLAAALRSFFPAPGEAETEAGFSFRLLLPWALLALAAYALTNLWVALKLFIYNLGTVFNAWDVVVSWNRWAAAWAANGFPSDSHFYPQLVPISWATTYVAMGGTDIHFFAKAIMPLFPLFLLVLLLDLGLQFKQIGPFLALALTQLLLKKFLGEELSNGYVDVAVAFFGFLPLHALLVARSRASDDGRWLLLALGAVFAVGASLTKQSGLYIFAFYPLLVLVAFFRPVNQWTKNALKKSLAFYATIALLPVSWYVFRVVVFQLGMDRAETAGLVQISSTAYQHVGLFAQIVAAMGNFDRYLYLFLVILAALPLLDWLYAALVVLIVLPYPLLWAWGAAYDTRNLALFLPVFTLSAGLALQALFELGLRLLDKSGLNRIKLRWAWLLVLLVFLAGAAVYSGAVLQNRQTEQELQSFSPAINAEIFAIIKRDGAQTKFLTNYPVRYLPGLENNQIQFSFRDYPRFLEFAKDPDIKYLLIPGPQLDGQIESYIKGKIAAGDYQVVLMDKNWVKFTLVEIVRR